MMTTATGRCGFIGIGLAASAASAAAAAGMTKPNYSATFVTPRPLRHARASSMAGPRIRSSSPLALLLSPCDDEYGRLRSLSRGTSSRSSALRSSVAEETIETEESSAGNNNETLGVVRVFDEDGSDLALIATIGDGNNNDCIDDDGGDGDFSPQQLQVLDRFFPPPVASALDPAALEAAVWVAGDAVAGDVVVVVDSPAVATSVVTPAPTMKQEDLELTLPAMAKYAERSSSDASLLAGAGGEADDESKISSQSLLELETAAADAVRGPHSMESEIGGSDPIERQPDHHRSASKRSVLDETPSILKILRYTVPAIGIWLCSPVLSMIDTAAVGLLSGTAQQAALNPAVSVTDQGALVVAFMYTATTNLIAAAVQEDANDVARDSGSRQPRTRSTLTTALKLALYVGTIFGAILGASGESLLRALMGNDAVVVDPAVFDAALRYVRIRALGMPAMVVIGTAQSACLGMRDVRSPLYVLMAAAVVNFLGDVVLVPRASSVMFGGAAGAAWATVASQWVAVLFFARWLTTDAADPGDSVGTKRKVRFPWNRRNRESVVTTDTDAVDITQGIMELAGTSKVGRSRRTNFRKLLSSSRLSRRIRLPSKFKSLGDNRIPTATTIRPRKKQAPGSRGFLSGSELTLRKYLSPSNIDKSAARKFLPFVVPVTTTSIGRISGYVAMSHVASSTLGTHDMAAHQIVFSIFCCLAPFVDALSQVAQSFVPAVFEAKKDGRGGRERAAALRRTVGNFRAVGAGFGAALLFLVTRIPAMGAYFTTDPVVLERVCGAMPGVGLFLLLNGLMCAGEGSLLGQKDLKFLRNMYAIFFFAVPACMLRLKYRALAGVQVVGVGTMWAAFSIYQVIRTSIWHLRLAQLQKRTERRVLEDTRR